VIPFTMTDSISNAVLTSPATHESNISSEHEYTDVISLRGTVCDQPLDKLLGPWLPGVGRADLVKITVKITTTAAKQKVYIGFASVNSSMTAVTASGKLSGLRFVSNERNAGDEIVKTLIPEDTLSRQIRPNSAMLTMMQFLVHCDDEVLLDVHFFVKVHGMRQQYGDLK